jgi:hypothetical protein
MKIAAVLLTLATAGAAITWHAGIGETPSPPVAYTPASTGPQGYASYLHMRMVDENGSVPEGALMRAEAQAQQMRIASNVAGNVAGISRPGWTWIGPGNIGGRIRGLVVHPTTTTTLFAGSVGGGLWKSTNSGGTWAPINDFLSNLAVSCLVFQPGTPSTMYAGTGEGFYNYDAIRGAGIFKSTDSGGTWTQLASTTSSDFHYINRIAFSANGTIMLVATNTGIFKSVDGGNNWTKVFGVSPIEVRDVKFLPGSNLLAVAGLAETRSYYSADGGQTWTLATGLTFSSSGRVEIGTSVSSPSTVYLSVDRSSGEIWRSQNNGVSYTLMSTPAHLGGQGWYDNVIWVDPTNVSRVVAAGVRMYQSTTAGASFSQIALNMHTDHHAIVHDPGYNGTTNKRVYFGNDGGVYKTEDILAATTFTELNNNFGVTQFLSAAGHAATGKIIGGTQDNGTLFYSTAAGSEGWTSPFGGDGGFSAADPTDSNYLYGEYVNLNIHRNTTGGSGASSYIYGLNNTFTACKAAPYRIDDACNGEANFIAPFMLDPTNASRMYAGGKQLWRTNDVKAALTNTTGPAWTAVKAASATAFNYISAIAVAPGTENIVYVGHNNGDIYVTINGPDSAPTWTKVDAAALPNRVVTRIVVPNGNDNINVAYATFGGFASNNVWRTANRGQTWTQITGTGGTALPSAPVHSLAVHPANSAWLYAGTEVGVFASTDTGTTWALPHEGPASVSVHELFWMGSTLVAATHGRGLFKTTAPIETLGAATLSVSANSTPAVQLSWSSVSGATAYVIKRNTTPGATSDYVIVGATLTYTDDAVNFDETYYYRVAALDSAFNQGPLSNEVSATAPRFTDDPLGATATPVKAIHITELRKRINEMRVRWGLLAATWTDPTIVPGTTLIKAVHLTEMRAALNAAFVKANKTPPTYSPSTVTVGTTVITAAQLNELRAAVLLLK